MTLKYKFSGGSAEKAKKHQMIKALVESLGIVTEAAKASGVDRTLHYAWLRNDAQYKAAVDDIFEQSVDFSENKLFECIKNCNVQAIMFHLRYRGKQRGYTDSLKIEHSGDISVDIDVKSMTDEELRELIES